MLSDGGGALAEADAEADLAGSGWVATGAPASAGAGGGGDGGDISSSQPTRTTANRVARRREGATRGIVVKTTHERKGTRSRRRRVSFASHVDPAQNADSKDDRNVRHVEHGPVSDVDEVHDEPSQQPIGDVSDGAR